MSNLPVKQSQSQVPPALNMGDAPAYKLYDFLKDIAKKIEEQKEYKGKIRARIYPSILENGDFSNEFYIYTVQNPSLEYQLFTVEYNVFGFPATIYRQRREYSHFPNDSFKEAFEEYIIKLVFNDEENQRISLMIRQAEDSKLPTKKSKS